MQVFVNVVLQETTTGYNQHIAIIFRSIKLKNSTALTVD